VCEYANCIPIHFASDDAELKTLTIGRLQQPKAINTSTQVLLVKLEKSWSDVDSDAPMANCSQHDWDLSSVYHHKCPTQKHREALYELDTKAPSDNSCASMMAPNLPEFWYLSQV